jgi:hypothetical protein
LRENLRFGRRMGTSRDLEASLGQALVTLLQSCRNEHVTSSWSSAKEMLTRRSLAEHSNNARETRLKTGGTPGVLLDRNRTRVLGSDATGPNAQDSGTVLDCQATYVCPGLALIPGMATVMSPDQE